MVLTVNLQTVLAQQEVIVTHSLLYDAGFANEQVPLPPLAAEKAGIQLRISKFGLHIYLK